MIQYSQYECEVKNRIKEIALAKGLPLLIAAVVSLLLTTYFLFVGIMAEQSEALKIGWWTALLCLVCIILYLGILVTLKKALNSVFKQYAENGKIDFTLERVEDKLKITRLCDNKTVEIKQSEIKSIRFLKSVILIILKGKRWFDLPNSPEVKELISTVQNKY